MSLVVRKMPVPTIEPTVSRAPSQVLKPRTRRDSWAGRGAGASVACGVILWPPRRRPARDRNPGRNRGRGRSGKQAHADLSRRSYFFSVNVITACVLPPEEETITLASRLPSALLPVTVPPVWPLVV